MWAKAMAMLPPFLVSFQAPGKGFVFKSRSGQMLRNILTCVGIQRSILLFLTSATTGGAETWREESQSFPPVNFTVVTAMFDIGRGDWESEYARPYRHYLHFLKPVMNLQVNFVIFADSVAAKTIRHLRRHRQDTTLVVEMDIEDLPYFHLKDRFQSIMSSQSYRKGNLLASMRHPEANVPEYDVLMLSKTHFVAEAMNLDPFRSSYFIWLDGGYGHGQEHIFPEDGIWKPDNLFQHVDKVTIVQLGPNWVEEAREHSHRLHRVRGSLILGGFFGGGKKALRRLYRLERAVVEGWMRVGMVDDDQTCRVMAYYQDPALFRLLLGDWWDVFQLFNETAAV